MATTTALPTSEDTGKGDMLKYTTDCSELTLEDLKATLPKSVAKKIDKDFVDNFNKTIVDPIYREQVKANYLGYIGVIHGGKYKALDYLNAVKFCTFILAGYTNKDAYYMAFPERVKQFTLNGTSAKDIQNLVNGYKRNKLVKTILEQSITPSWIVNQDVYQEAINVLVKEMYNPKAGPMVRVQAANALVSELSPPKETKMQIGIAERDRDSLDALTNSIREFSNAQQKALEAGAVNLKDVAHAQIIDGDCEEV